MNVIHISVNGVEQTVPIQPNATLADVLRNHLGLTGTKIGCGKGDCGACTVLVDGVPVYSCMTLAARVDGCDVTTIEGLTADGRLHPLQTAFLESGAVQCGFCTPGMVLVAKALLDENPHPDRAEISEAISGNLCRCTGYQQIVDAVESYSRRRSE